MKGLGLVSSLVSILALAGGAWAFIQWQRKDAVKDFMLEAALTAAEARAENQSTMIRITEEIDDATIDELRERAAAGGMFVFE
jgi:hypothetical protein